MEAEMKSQIQELVKRDPKRFNGEKLLTKVVLRSLHLSDRIWEAEEKILGTTTQTATTDGVKLWRILVTLVRKQMPGIPFWLAGSMPGPVEDPDKGLAFIDHIQDRPSFQDSIFTLFEYNGSSLSDASTSGSLLQIKCLLIMCIIS